MTGIERRLLNDFQRGFPLLARPYAALAERLGVTEEELLACLRGLAERGAVSRVGAVLRPQRIGASALVAMAVPPARLDQVAALVNAYPEVNHNYEREHRYNLWFVLTAVSEQRLDAIVRELERRTGIAALVLPMIEEYHIDLGFELQWD